MPGLEDRFAPPPRFADASDQLHALVAQQVGAEDFGPDDYLEGLRVLLLSMDFDPLFSERGRRIAWGELVSALSGRAQAYKAMKQVPRVAQRPVDRPVVITGIPRTGTTALHKLMAVDPQFQGLQGWLIAHPEPRPPRESWATNPHFLNAVERLNARFASKPDLKAAHDMAADEVDECVGVLRQGFVSNLWTCAWTASSYDLWWRTQSERECYRHLRRVLQLIGSSEPDKRWLLKNPGHIDNLDRLFETFPDAMVINTHRDPASAVPSLCQILVKNHALLEEGRREAWPPLLGIRETEKWANAVHKAERVKRTRESQVIDIVHADFHARPMETIERIYGFLGLELRPDICAAMERRIVAAPERQHGPHRYAAEDFGMSAEGIRARFGDYIDRFDLRPRRADAARAAR